MDLTYIRVSSGWAERQGNAISAGPISDLSLSPSKFKRQPRFCWTAIQITSPNATEFKRLPSCSAQPLSGKGARWLCAARVPGTASYACELCILRNLIQAVVFVRCGVKYCGFAPCLGSAAGEFAFYLEGVFFLSLSQQGHGRAAESVRPFLFRISTEVVARRCLSPPYNHSHVSSGAPLCSILQI